jgi:AcrR family transcriptional regulator
MARPVRPERRDELLDGLVDHLLACGLTGFSLRPAASAVGATPRTLLYHFGSKERLEIAILEAIRRRERRLFGQWIANSEADSLSDVVLAVWKWLAAEERRAFLTLFFQAYLASVADPTHLGSFAASAVEDWLAFLVDILRSFGIHDDDASDIGTAILATVRGALLDLLATDARDRLDRIIHQFADSLPKSHPVGDAVNAGASRR